MRLIMLSPPGAGKGTHSALLSQASGVAHISSGDLLRAEIARGTDPGRQLAGYTNRGDLVPDELIFEILVPAVQAADRDSGGYLLDGFPRTMAQARRAAQLGVELELASDAVIYLTAPETVLVERLLSRAAREGRADDTLDVIQHRLAVFAEQTSPLVDYYRSRDILLEIDADRDPVVVQADIRDRLTDRTLARPVVTAPAGAGPPTHQPRDAAEDV
jgi:adenylate kinase